MTAWTDFVKQYAKEKNLSYKEAMKQAAPSYKQHKENPCPKGHTVCSCSAEPPTPTEPPTPDEVTQNIQNIYKQNKEDTKLTKKQLYDPLSVLSPTDQTKVKNLVNNLKIPSVKEMLALLKNKTTEPQINEVISKKIKKKKLKMPLPYRKVTLNILEDDAIELPKIEPPEPQTRELIETIETIEEPIKQKKKKSRKVKLDIQGDHLPPLVSETEDDLNKTPIPKLKEMLKELNFTKFAKFKKQDYVDKILELKNIPKGVWWRHKYDFLYSDLKTLYSYLDDTTMFNIEYIKRALLKDINKLEELKKSNLKGEQRRQKYRLIKDQIERFEEFIKEFDKLNNIDFEKEVEKLENEDAERNKRIDKYFEKKESEPTPVVVPLEAAFFNRYKK